MTFSHEEFVDQHFKVTGRSGDERDVICPAHGDRNASMRINVAKGVFFCHGCHITGGMQALAKLIGVSYKYDATEAALSLLATKLGKLSRNEGEAKPAFLPEETLDRYRLMPTGYWNDPQPNGRGFTQETIDAFDLGYDPMREAAIIPVRNHRGFLLGVTRRFLAPDADLKYKDPKGFDKQHNLFGSWLASEHESPLVVLTEGPLDAIKVWQAGYPAVAQYGSMITEAQIKLLRRMGTTTVVLFYDNDAGGTIARKAAMGVTWHKQNDKHIRRYTRERDLRQFFIVKRVRYTGVTAKDPGELQDAQVRRLVKESRYVDS